MTGYKSTRSVKIFFPENHSWCNPWIPREGNLVEVLRAVSKLPIVSDEKLMPQSVTKVRTLRVAVANMNRVSPSSTMAHNRIAVYLAKRFAAPLLDRPGVWDGSQYDLVFVVNGLWHFCPWRDELLHLARGARAVVWCGNDYKLPIPKPIRELETLRRWCEYEGAGIDKVNWNELTFDSSPLPRDPAQFPGIFYWGALREGRTELFKKYLDSRLYPVLVSTTKRAEFSLLAPGAEVIPPVDLRRTLARVQATIYIEDSATQVGGIPHSPANRFYESLSAGVLTLFDERSVAAINQAGFDVGPWTVSSPEDVRALLEAAPSQLELREQVRASLSLHQQVSQLAKQIQ